MEFSSPSFINQISKSSRVALINLGCARNLCDAQVILGKLKAKGHSICNINKSDVVILNTCAFIEEAKKETIDTILDLIELKKKGKIKKIVVLGCFPQRYPKEVRKEFKEIDVIGGILPLSKSENSSGFLLTPKSYGYLKICESCYHHCSFCAIPKIKGKFSSRLIKAIVEEAKILDNKNIHEIDIIGQDITAYGLDVYKKKSLVSLLRSLIKETKNVRWFRLLYSFPAHITKDLLRFISQEKRMCKYIDVPLQHINDRILKSMDRKFSKTKTISLIKKIRRLIPECCLRTSFIVGYPGETEKEFKELYSFIKEFQFDRVGVFTYSKEEGTRAALLPDQISENVKQQRYEKLMDLQQTISTKKLKKLVGRTIDIVVDEKSKKEKSLYVGRSEYDAPEVDGIVYVRTKKALKVGDYIRVEIIDSYEYDLLGKFKALIKRKK